MRLRKQSGPVEPNKDGTFRINLTESERDAFDGLLDQLHSLLLAGPDDSRVRRLYPTAYHENPEHDSEYQQYMRDELTESRAAAIATVREVLKSPDSISESQLMAFMRVLNSLRLVLGTLLDVSEDDFEDETDPDEDDPLFPQWSLYGYLGWLLEWVVATLAGDRP